MTKCEETTCYKDELAGKLFTAYSNAVGGIAFNGESIPAWSEFSTDPAKTVQADGWRAVAETVIGMMPSDEGTDATPSESSMPACA